MTGESTESVTAPSARLPLQPFVFARRWDRLGGRLASILNARAVAEAMGVEFRFIWPRGDDHELDDPREVFGEASWRRTRFGPPISSAGP